MAQSTLHLRGGLNPALGLGLPGLTDAQGFGTESQQLIRNQQPSALNQLLDQHKSLDGLKSTVPSIEQLLPQNKYPDDLKHTVPSTEQLPAQVNPTYAMNRSASAGQTSNIFESVTNHKVLSGNDLVGNNESHKPPVTASALTNFFQGSIQCFRPNGYGFISPADGSKDIFFHCNHINRKDSIQSNLNRGDTVTFNKKFDSHRKKWYATNVTVIGDNIAIPIQEHHDDGALPPKPPEIGTNIQSTPHTSSNTGDSKKPKKQNYDGGDDDDGYSGDDENEIPSIESSKGNRDKWGFLTSAKRKSTNKDSENVKKMKNTMVTRKQRLPKIPDDALSTIAKLTGDFQSILNLSIADPTLAVTISQWKCCDCDCDGPIFGSDRAYFRSLQEELGILSIPGTAKPFICKHGTFCGRNDCSGSNARQCSQCCDIMECGLCQKSRIADCKICTDVQEDIFYCRNC
jgi:cold shock CspA family protein